MWLVREMLVEKALPMICVRWPVDHGKGGGSWSAWHAVGKSCERTLCGLAVSTTVDRQSTERKPTCQTCKRRMK